MKAEPIEIKVKDFVPVVGELYIHLQPLRFIAKYDLENLYSRVNIVDESDLKQSIDKTIGEHKTNKPIMFVENTGLSLADVVGPKSYLIFALENDLRQYTIWKVLIEENCFFMLCSRLDCWQYKKIT